MKAAVVRLTHDRKTGKEIKRETLEEKEVPDSFFTIFHEARFPEIYEDLKAEMGSEING